MFAEVAIPRTAPGLLTYAVPEAYQALVVPGVRVRVPLRKRATTGLVVAVAATTDLAAEAVRPLEEVLDTEPLLPPHLLELASFVASYYRCPLGVTLASMVPAGLLRADAEAVELTVAGAAADPDALPQRQRDQLRCVQSRQRLRVAALFAAAGGDRAALSSLEQAGLVRVTRRRRDRAPQVEVAAVALAPASPEVVEAACKRAPRRRAVLDWLAAAGRPALVSEVVAAVGCSDGVIRALVEKGLLQRFTQLPARRARWQLEAGGSPVELTGEQRAAVDAVSAAIGSATYAPFLLQGITGSGKTEVYLRCVEATLAAGRSAIVLVPEIGLTPAASGAVERRFGAQAAVLHSAMSEGERWREWSAIRNGGPTVVVGPRSALFAPVASLGLIVVDEEHDGAYKQQEAPRYHARDLALVLGQRLGVPVLLCAATPSTEAAGLVERGLATRLSLTSRVAGGALPETELVDLRGQPPEPGEKGLTLFSPRLRELLGETLGRGEQAILLIQRRGWAPVLQCRDCGLRLQCPECSVSLVVHHRSQDLRCHYCGSRSAMPAACPTCGGTLLEAVGAGTEKVAHHLERYFPGVTNVILDRDTVRRRDGLEESLGAFAAGRAQVLVGTQMVAKGHHFPNVTLTGVISADALLSLPDYRAGERTFQLLTQVAGRSGRGCKPGRVVIQTYYPDHPAVRHASRHDVDAFLAEELVYRTAFRYPPSVRLALVRLEAAREADARQAAQKAAAALDGFSAELRLRGPAPAPLERIRNRFRWQLLLSAASRAPLRQALDLVEAVPLPASVHRVVDVDPLSTL